MDPRVRGLMVGHLTVVRCGPKANADQRKRKYGDQAANKIGSAIGHDQRVSVAKSMSSVFRKGPYHCPSR